MEPRPLPATVRLGREGWKGTRHSNNKHIQPEEFHQPTCMGWVEKAVPNLLPVLVVKLKAELSWVSWKPKVPPFPPDFSGFGGGLPPPPRSPSTWRDGQTLRPQSLHKVHNHNKTSTPSFTIQAMKNF